MGCDGIVKVQKEFLDTSSAMTGKHIDQHWIRDADDRASAVRGGFGNVDNQVHLLAHTVQMSECSE